MKDSKLSIRPLVLDDATHFAAHVRVGNAESGCHGQPHFHPYSADSPFDVLTYGQAQRRCWQMSLSAPGWRRVWGLFRAKLMVGHIVLDGSGLHSALHRANVGMAILSQYRGQGGGRRLLHTVIDWSEQHAQLHWLDLGVFTENPGAHALYLSLGFKERGRTLDCFRIDGHRVDDIQMSRWVGPAGREPT